MKAYEDRQVINFVILKSINTDTCSYVYSNSIYNIIMYKIRPTANRKNVLNK